MASLVRIGFTRVVNNGTSAGGFMYVGVRNISGKTMRVKELAKKPAPWPYKTKRYGLLQSIFDRTSSRFDENSKLIVVEGPVASGKSKFAQELAEELEMAYFPEANLDMLHTNEYGFNTKQLDDQLPEACRSFDINNFLLNPKHQLTARMQIQQYIVKYSQYIDALAHIFNTGQGVILDRSAFSDFVFLEAMYSRGYLSRGARSVYYEVRKNTISELLRPHLVIYLDVPTSKVIENVKQRKITCEQNSQVLTKDYLNVMEKYYKQEYLKDISQTAELLIYDWSNEGEVEVVVEDIERINFVRTDPQDPKFYDWRYKREEQYAEMRIKYTTQKDFLLTYCNVPSFEVPEFVVEAEDAKEAKEVLATAPGSQYAAGYNKSMGDGISFLKMGIAPRDTLPHIERQLQ